MFDFSIIESCEWDELYFCEIKNNVIIILYRHQCVHRGVGRDRAHFAAGGEISRHRVASHQCVGIVSGCECGNGAEKRGDLLGGGHQRRGGRDLHEVVGEQWFGERFFLTFAAVLFFRITEKSLLLQSKLLLLPLWALPSVY